jgi:hypothetical protein
VALGFFDVGRRLVPAEIDRNPWPTGTLRADRRDRSAASTDHRHRKNSAASVCFPNPNPTELEASPTYQVFRTVKLARAGLMEKVFDWFDRYLEAQGY